MQLVEKQIIELKHWLDKQLDNWCFLSQNLFNYSNYLIRQKFIGDGKYLDYYKVQKLCQGTPDDLALSAKVSQQVLLRLDESWKSFWQLPRSIENILRNSLQDQGFLTTNKRIKRGLFRAGDGRLINADVNGSANMVKKAFPNPKARGNTGHGSRSGEGQTLQNGCTRQMRYLSIKPVTI